MPSVRSLPEAMHEAGAMLLEREASISAMRPWYGWQLKPLKTWRH